jgi:hypothetical protein
MLYFFMHSGQALWPKGILALQKIHAADFPSALILSNEDNQGRWLLNIVKS